MHRYRRRHVLEMPEEVVERTIKKYAEAAAL
jgi:hypothetical protein